MAVAVAIPAQKVTDQAARSRLVGRDWINMPPTPRLANSTMIVLAEMMAAISPTTWAGNSRAATSQNAKPNAD